MSWTEEDRRKAAEEDAARQERELTAKRLLRERDAEIHAKLREAVLALGASWDQPHHAVRVNGGLIELKVHAVADRGEQYSHELTRKYKGWRFAVTIGKRSWRRPYNEMPYAEMAAHAVAVGAANKLTEEKERAAWAARSDVQENPRWTELRALLKSRGNGVAIVFDGGSIELRLGGLTLDEAEKIAALFAGGKP